MKQASVKLYGVRIRFYQDTVTAQAGGVSYTNVVIGVDEVYRFLMVKAPLGWQRVYYEDVTHINGEAVHA